jgi:hypothetical protein
VVKGERPALIVRSFAIFDSSKPSPPFHIPNTGVELKLGDANVLVRFGAKSLEEEDRKADERHDEENGGYNQVRFGAGLSGDGRLVDEFGDVVSAADDTDDTQKQE